MDAMRRDARSGRPLRVLWLIDSLAMGGAERLAVSFARGAAAEGIDLRVCCLKRIGGNPLEPDLRATGVPCDVLDARHLRDRGAFARLRSIIREQAVDLIHAHLLYATVWGTLAGRLEHVPAVATLHVSPSVGPAWSRDRLRERLMCALLRRSRATAILVSDALRRRYLERRLLDPSRTIVVPNGVETGSVPSVNPPSAASLRAAFELPPGARVLVTTAVLRDPRKGVDVLLEAMLHVLAARPDARLLVVGEGPLRPALQARARLLGLDGLVRWAGARHDVPSLLAGADLYVHPTLEDPFPTAVLEAMAAGLPVVATAVDGIPEMIADGRNGRLVPPADAPALAAALSDLLGDEDARSRLGMDARRTAIERFSARVWTQTLRRVYDRTLDARRLPARSDRSARAVAS